MGATAGLGVVTVVMMEVVLIVVGLVGGGNGKY